MRAKTINEKFTEKSDPIEDMGIGADPHDIIVADYSEKFKNEFGKFLENYEDTDDLIDDLGNMYNIRSLNQEVEDWFGVSNVDESDFDDIINEYASDMAEGWMGENAPEMDEFGEFPEDFEDPFSDAFNVNNIKYKLLNEYYDEFSSKYEDAVDYIQEPYINDDFPAKYKKMIARRKKK